MGEVWEAEQERPVRRRVAFKLIRWGMDTREVLARFETERQALALMNHPNIARVFEAGATDEGRPFFAMEYVKGIPITEYCDRATSEHPGPTAAVRARSAAVSSTPTRRASSTATSSRRTSWWRSRTGDRCPRSSTSGSPRRPRNG